MHALKSPFFRPTSRPNSPVPTPAPPSRPDSGVGFERVPRQINRLSLSSFRRPSPAPTQTLPPAPHLLVQDGSYLEMLGLKLSEAVSKAFTQPTGPATANEQVAGKRPIPTGRGHSLGSLIASELKASRENPHLHRATIRCLHRPLSVLMTNLSAHLLPLLSSPAFLSPPAPTQQAPNPNPTQLHAIALATFAGEVLETFDELGLGLDGDVRGDGLKPIREGLVSLAGRVFNPLIAGIKNELFPLLEALESLNSTAKGVAGTKSSAISHPSIVTLQGIMPVYAKAIARYTTTSVAQTTLATFLISIVWRGLVALAHRPNQPPSPPSSPDMGQILTKKSRRVSSSTAPPTPPAARFTIKLPPSRPPSPPSVQVPATPAADAHALYDLLNLFPRPVAGAEQEKRRLAREAVDEAFEGLKALAVLLEAVQAHAIVKGDSDEEELLDTLEELTADLPTLVALPILLRSYCPGGDPSRSVAAMLGLAEDEYRKGCLSGFARTEECANAVGQRMLDVFRGNPDASIVEKWLERELTPGAGADH